MQLLIKARFDDRPRVSRTDRRVAPPHRKVLFSASNYSKIIDIYWTLADTAIRTARTRSVARCEETKRSRGARKRSISGQLLSTLERVFGCASIYLGTRSRRINGSGAGNLSRRPFRIQPKGWRGSPSLCEISTNCEANARRAESRLFRDGVRADGRSGSMPKREC
jgi:hypothetical protein